jgi:hypothetical protein
VTDLQAEIVRLDAAVEEHEQRLDSAAEALGRAAEEIARNAEDVAELLRARSTDDASLTGLRAELVAHQGRLDEAERALAAVRDRLGREMLYAFDDEGTYLGPLIEHGVDSVKYFDSTLRLLVESFFAPSDPAAAPEGDQSSTLYFDADDCAGLPYTVAQGVNGSLGVLDQASGRVLAVGDPGGGPRDVEIRSQRGLWAGAACELVDPARVGAYALETLGAVKAFSAPVRISTAQW